jgi:hypothetical protein
VAPFAESRDSTGAVLVQTHRLLWNDPYPLPVAAPNMTIRGSSAGAVIGRLSGATRLRSGNVVLADGQSQRLYEYSPAGTLLRVLGGPGEGPGEFLALRTLSSLPGDTVVVYDPRLRRLSFFPPDDAPVRVLTLHDEALFPRTPTQVWALGEGRVLVLHGGDMREAAERPPPGPALFGPPAVLRMVSLAEGTSVELFKGGRTSEAIQDGSRFWSPAFGRAVHVAVARGQFVVLTTSVRHSVVRFDLMSGGAGATNEFRGADSPLTAAEVARVRAEARTAEGQSGPQFSAPEFLFDPALQPEIRPAFSDLLVAPNGFVLARVFAPLRQRSPEWWVVGPEGSFRGRVTAPGGGDLLEIGEDYLIAVAYDEYDVPKVEIRAMGWDDLQGTGSKR